MILSVCKPCIFLLDTSLACNAIFLPESPHPFMSPRTENVSRWCPCGLRNSKIVPDFKEGDSIHGAQKRSVRIWGGLGRPYRSWGHCARSCPGSPLCQNRTTSRGTAGLPSSVTLVSWQPPTRERKALRVVDLTFIVTASYKNDRKAYGS